MKKFLLFVMLTASSIFASAGAAVLSGFVEEGKTWTYHRYNPFWGKDYLYKMTLSGDTLIGNAVYKKVYSHNENNDGRTLYIGAVRQDGNKVYCMDSTRRVPRLVYDFGVMPGEKVSLCQNYVYAVDTFLVKGKALECIYFVNRLQKEKGDDTPLDFFLGGFWVDAIGSIAGSAVDPFVYTSELGYDRSFVSCSFRDGTTITAADMDSLKAEVFDAMDVRLSAPGTLADNVASVSSFVSRLKISGYINEEDVGQIRVMERLKDLNLADAVIVVGDDPGASTAEESAVFDEIYSGLFADCSQLESIVVPDMAKVVWTNAMKNCTHLKHIDLRHVEVICDYAFSGCSSVESLELPASVREVRTKAFCGMTSLKTVFLPAQLKTVCEGAFANCTSLSVVECLSEAAPQCADNTFEGVTGCTVYVPAGCSPAYKEAAGWRHLNIVEKDFAGVGAVSVGEESHASDMTFYSVDGRRVVNPSRGVVIVRKQGAKPRKVYLSR